MRLLNRSTLLLASLVLLTLTACGFQLRGSYSLPFTSIFVNVPEYSKIGADLKRYIRASGSTELVDSAQEAEATFISTNELRVPVILTLSSAGRVTEKRLRYIYAYRVIDSKGLDMIPSGTVDVFRDLTYADSDVLAKTQEEELLWKNMEQDVVQQLMRRLSSAKLIVRPAGK